MKKREEEWIRARVYMLITMKKKGKAGFRWVVIFSWQRFLLIDDRTPHFFSSFSFLFSYSIQPQRKKRRKK